MEYNTALKNYVKFYYEKLNDHEETLTENLDKICYAFDLQDFEDELKEQIKEKPPADLRNKEIDCAKVPKWLDREIANDLFTEIKSLRKDYKPEILEQLNQIQRQGHDRDVEDPTFIVINQYSDDQLEE